VHAELSGLVGTGGDNPASLAPLGIGAYDQRLASELRMVALFDSRKKSVHVDMQNGASHNPFLLLQANPETWSWIAISNRPLLTLRCGFYEIQY
jgi:hypothetical protein